MIATTPPSVLSALRFIQEPDYDRFEPLALEIFEFQMARNEPYRRYCSHRGISRAQDWTSIPPLPARAFKECDLWTAPPERTFLTSGTTRGIEKRGGTVCPPWTSTPRPGRLRFDVTYYRISSACAFFP